MSSDTAGNDSSKSKRRRRRRRRSKAEGGAEEPRRGAREGGGAAAAAAVGAEGGGGERSERGGRGGRRRGGDRGERGERGERRERGEPGDDAGLPGVSTLNSTRNLRKRRKRKRRAAPVSGLSRRRRMTHTELEELEDYFNRMPKALLANLYKAIGGQPGRVADQARMVQLAVRAISQGKRLGGIVKAMHERERNALALLIQCGGVAHSDEFHRELMNTLGGHERDWARLLVGLAERGLVCASEADDDQFFYLVPDPLIEHLVEHIEAELMLSTFQHDDVKVRDARPFCPPLDFSITTLATYIAQRPPRLTQQQEIFKVHQEEMDRFFAQLWEPGSELFHFHIDFLMTHGLVELRGDRLSVNQDVVEEFLNLDDQDQRDLVLRSLERRFPYAEWVLWAVRSGRGAWIAEQHLQALYRRWTRGEDWRRRFQRGELAATRTNERESWSFAPLVHCGMLELGEWGQEKFYRLTPRATALLDPPEQDGFSRFYLTPSFEVMAPAGLSPQILFNIGSIAELTGCDRANTYKITEVTVEQGLERGWRREDVLDFLRENSQIGLPENVEQTLRGWMGGHGDVELHDCMLLTVHKGWIKRVETSRELKPWLLHRFAPGLYAVDRTRLPELMAVLGEAGFSASKDITRYPGDTEQSGARDRLLNLLAEAREGADDPLARAQTADTQPEDLHPVPGSGASKSTKKKAKEPPPPPRVTPREAKAILERAVALRQKLEILYVGKDGARNTFTVAPERLALNAQGEQVFVAVNVANQQRLTWKLLQVERIRPLS